MFKKLSFFFLSFHLMGFTCSLLFIKISPIGAAPIFTCIIEELDSFKGITMNLPKQRVYLGVRTCEIFLCSASFVFLGSIVLTSLFPFFAVTWSFTGSYSKLNDIDTVHSD